MRRLINNIISVVCSFAKFTLIKLFHRNNFVFFPIERFSPNVVTEFNKGSKVVLGKKIRVHSGSKIKVRNGGILNIGDNVKINYNCFIVCHDRIEIGEGTEFGPSVYLYDHDHDYKFGLNNNRYVSNPIVIGENCWIGANSIILNGTTIGNNCVIGAGSVVKGEIPPNSLYLQKRDTTLKTFDIFDIDDN